MKAPKTKKPNKWLVVVICLILMLFIFHALYGYVFPIKVVEAELGFSLPSGYRLIEYQYSAGDFGALLSYEGDGAFQQIVHLMGGNGCHQYKLDANEINTGNINFLESKETVEAMKFLSLMHEKNSWGILFHNNDGTILYISRPWTGDFLGLKFNHYGDRI